MDDVIKRTKELIQVLEGSDLIRNLERYKARIMVKKNLLELIYKYNNSFDDYEKLYPCMMEMIAVITKISDISFLKQERAKNMFYEEFDKFMMEDVREKTNVKIDKDFSPEIDSK